MLPLTLGLNQSGCGQVSNYVSVKMTHTIKFNYCFSQIIIGVYVCVSVVYGVHNPFEI